MQDLRNFSVKGVPCPMVFVPPGNFQIEGGKEICFKKGFYIGKYPVTQALWQAVMRKNPSYFKGDNFPVETITWDDICQTNGFLDYLNGLEGIKKNNLECNLQFHLPTETMWEFAAKGGNQYRDFSFSGSHNLREVGWYDKNSYNETKPVGLKLPNELGIYDMNGNVWEWCADYWHENYENTPNDGSIWSIDSTTRRVIRGGSWDDTDYDCRVSTRFRNNTYGRGNGIGFRLALY